MKFLALSILAFVFALPAHAQHAAGASGSTRPSQGGGGGGGETGGADYGGSSHIAVTQFSVVTAHGEPDYVQSSFMNYDTALQTGEAALAMQHKTVAEVAREYRAEKARKQAQLSAQ